MTLYNELQSSNISGSIHDIRKKVNYSSQKNFIYKEIDDA